MCYLASHLGNVQESKFFSESLKKTKFRCPKNPPEGVKKISDALKTHPREWARHTHKHTGIIIQIYKPSQFLFSNDARAPIMVIIALECLVCLPLRYWRLWNSNCIAIQAKQAETGSYFQCGVGGVVGGGGTNLFPLALPHQIWWAGFI